MSPCYDNMEHWLSVFFCFSLELNILTGDELIKSKHVQSYLVLDSWEYSGEVKGALIDCIQINSLGLTKPGTEGFIEITIDIKGLKKIKAVVHNEGHFYHSNYFNLFGSDIGTLNVVGKQSDGVVAKFHLSRTHLLSIDQPKDRCGENVGNLTTTMCIMNFLNHEIGCQVPLQNMEGYGQSACNKTEQFDELLDLGYELEHSIFTESRMHEATGCLSPCEKVSLYCKFLTYMLLILILITNRTNGS